MGSRQRGDNVMGRRENGTITQVEARGWRRIVEAGHLICPTQIKSCPVTLGEPDVDFAPGDFRL